MRIGEIKQEAKTALKGNWGLAIGASLLNNLMVGGIMFISVIVMMIVMMMTITTMFYHNLSVFTAVLMVILVFVVFLALLLLLVVPLQIGLEWMFLNFIDEKKQKVDPLFRRKQDVGNLFDAFKKNYWKNVSTIALQSLFLGLWGGLFGAIDGLAFIFGPTVQLIVSLITWIPLIIITLGYSLVTPLLKDHPEYRAIEIIRESKRLMRGNKGKYFLLGLSFVLWYVPGLFAYIVGFIMFIFNITVNPLNPHVGAMVISGILILIGFLYLVGISFYVMPYLQASYAAFYRTLKPLPPEKTEGTDFYSNAPQPLNTNNENSEYGLYDSTESIT